MLKKLVKTIFSFSGMSIGFALYFLLLDFLASQKIEISITVKWFGLIFVVTAFGALFEVITPHIIKLSNEIVSLIEKESAKVGAFEMAMGIFGLIIGLIFAYFISKFTLQIPFIGLAITILVYMFLAFLGYSLSVRRKDEVSTILKASRDGQFVGFSGILPNYSVKVVDTSVIIDGRILDVAQTGFLEGKIIIPNFVLEELRHIADSSDDLKRQKGRRGLDILNELQSNTELDIEISDADFSDIPEVDMKLLKLAQEVGGKVITNDYNLNKVAQIQGVTVLNINELANAVKTVVIPGEEMSVNIVKEGKEQNQGVGYLDDGTMIVVENSRNLIGETIGVVVTTVLQTAAGRMIFARQK